MDFPRVITEIIISYTGDWAAETSVINFECKQICELHISNNSHYLLLLYCTEHNFHPDRIIVLEGNKCIGKLSSDANSRFSLISIKDDGSFLVVVKSDGYYLQLYNKNCEFISGTESFVYRSSYISNSYVIHEAHREIQYVTKDHNSSQIDISDKIVLDFGGNVYYVCAHDDEYIIFRHDDNSTIIVYSAANRSEIAKIKFDRRRFFPNIIKLINVSSAKYLVTITDDLNELKIFDEKSNFSNMLTEYVAMAIKISVLDMYSVANRMHVIFGNQDKGLYSFSLDNIKNIVKLPINNFFTNFIVHDNMIITFGPGITVTKYGLTKNIKMFRELSTDKPKNQYDTVIV
jgi:hypothetical protein